MIQRLPVAFAQVKASNTSENLLNEIWQMIYSSCWAKEITKKHIQQHNESNKVITQNGYYIFEF